MIFLALDSSEEERDIDRKKPAHVTWREFRWWIVILIAVLMLGYYFGFLPWKADRDFVVGKNNLKEIGQALGLYAASNSDGYPATYLPNVKDPSGNPITWANALFDYMPRVEALISPAAPQEGDTILSRVVKSDSREVIILSYGMLAACSALRKYEMFDATVVIAETIGGGVDGSYNPVPLGGRDGFLIGYDNSNTIPNGETQSATRLAFTKGGASSIHGPRGIAGLRADGGIAILTDSGAARVGKRGKVASGPWVPN